MTHTPAPLCILWLQKDLPVEWDVLAALPPTCTVHAATTDEEALRLAPDADVVVAGFGGGGMLRRAWPLLGPKLRWVHAMSAGVDWLMFDGLRNSAVPFTNARGVYARSLAEFCVLGLLHFAKDVPRLASQKAAGTWQPFLMEELRDRTLAVVGYGEIGRACARLANALGMHVTALKRHPGRVEPGSFHVDVRGMDGLRDALRRTDHVLLCLPHTPETQRVVGREELACLRPHGVLVNVGRGTTVDEEALVEVLRERRIRGAALDVFEHEPLAEGHPFWTLPNVLLSPHCADRNDRWQKESTRLLVDNVVRFMGGQPLLNVVDKALGY